MKNWSGLLTWQPSEIYKPSTETQIVDIVTKAAKANKKVRIIGSGHSFTSLCVTDDILISLDEFQGIIRVDADHMQATVKAGTKLNTLNRLLNEQGMALANLGDIDVQSIAGAISTGTHGTGVTFGNLSTMVTAMKWVNGKGEIVSCSETDKPELLKAAQVSLGMFGVITELTIQCVPKYNLHIKVQKLRLDEVLSNLDIYNKCRNFEFYWFPNTEYVMSKEIDQTDAKSSAISWKDYAQEIVLENYAFKAVCELSRMLPRSTRRISRFSANMIDSFEKTRKSFEVFSTSRLVKFHEMEYNIPAEAYLDVKKEIVNWVNKHNYDILFPLENRFVAADDIMLSPSYKRPSAYIAVHVYNKKDYKHYFENIEAIFRSYQGRPHWGKMHTRTQAELKQVYPMFETFQKYREVQDPDQVFLSPYLKDLFA